MTGNKFVGLLLTLKMHWLSRRCSSVKVGISLFSRISWWRFFSAMECRAIPVYSCTEHHFLLHRGCPSLWMKGQLKEDGGTPPACTVGRELPFHTSQLARPSWKQNTFPGWRIIIDWIIKITLYGKLSTDHHDRGSPKKQNLKKKPLVPVILCVCA